MSSIETRVSKCRVSKLEYRNSSIEMSSIEKSKFESRESIKSAMLHTSLMSFLPTRTGIVVCCIKFVDFFLPKIPFFSRSDFLKNKTCF